MLSLQAKSIPPDRIHLGRLFNFWPRAGELNLIPCPLVEEYKSVKIRQFAGHQLPDPRLGRGIHPRRPSESAHYPELYPSAVPGRDKSRGSEGDLVFRTQAARRFQPAHNYNGRPLSQLIVIVGLIIEIIEKHEFRLGGIDLADSYTREGALDRMGIPRWRGTRQRSCLRQRSCDRDKNQQKTYGAHAEETDFSQRLHPREI